MPRPGERQTHAFIRSDADPQLKDAHLVSGRCASLPPTNAHLSHPKMRIFQTGNAHPRNTRCASAKRKPCIRHKEAPHPSQESPAFAARAHGILPHKKKDAHPPRCGRCASPCKAFGADQPSGLSPSSPPGVVEPPVPSPAPGVVSSAEAGSSIHSSCSVSTRARV